MLIILTSSCQRVRETEEILEESVLMICKNMAGEVVILLSISVIVAFTTNYFSPKGIALFGEWDTSKGVVTAKSKEDVVVRDLEIPDILMAKKMYDTGKHLFIDARDPMSYEDGHVKGAISLPIGQFYEIIDDFISQYPLTTPLITYCSGRECDDSHKLAHQFMEEGYAHVNVFIDGYSAWETEGYPIE